MNILHISDMHIKTNAADDDVRYEVFNKLKNAFYSLKSAHRDWIPDIIAITGIQLLTVIMKNTL